MDDVEPAPYQSETALPQFYEQTENTVKVSSNVDVQGPPIVIAPQCSEQCNDRLKEISTNAILNYGEKINFNVENAEASSENINEKSIKNSESNYKPLAVEYDAPKSPRSKAEPCVPPERVSPNIEQGILSENFKSLEMNQGGNVSSNKSSTPLFVYDPNKVFVKFLFANRDGIHVLVDFNPEDTIGEMKGALIQAWPESKYNRKQGSLPIAWGMRSSIGFLNLTLLLFIPSDIPPCSDIDAIRLICMGRGVLMPDTRTLRECGVPVFETHATPVNVSVRPLKGGQRVDGWSDSAEKKKRSCIRNPSDAIASAGGRDHNREAVGGTPRDVTGQGCACVLL